MRKVKPLIFVLFILTLLIIFILLYILYDIASQGINKISFEFLSEDPKNAMISGGIFPAIFGTILLVIIMSVGVMPFGVITAIYLSEYVSNTGLLVRFIRLAINNLAGIPSIIFGLFGLGFFINFIGKTVIDDWILGEYNVWGRPSIIWAALTLALLTLPVVVVSTEEALKSIPKDIREASFALGATRFQTIIRLIIPNALRGILTGSILAVSRAAGEVAPVLFTGAAYYLKDLPNSLTDKFMELGYHIYILATQSPNMEATRPILYATVFVLLSLIFVLNLLVVIFRIKFKKRF